MRLATLAAKTYFDGAKENRPLVIPLVHATTFQAADSLSHGQLFRAGAGTVYQRFGHPTVAAAEAKIARLEGAEAALLFSSGMGAITSSLLALLEEGDHVVAQREIFAQTFTFLDGMASSFGVTTEFVSRADPGAVDAAIRPNTKLVYVESPSNPLLHLADIRALARVAQLRGVHLLVDSTFASPCLQNPLAMGASLVLHSGTKFLGGHSDVMCGVAAGDRAIIARVQAAQVLLGSVLAPEAAWLLLRGLKTMVLRMERQSDNALVIAHFLSGVKGIRRVHYPFLETSPQYHLARSQMRAGGGVLSFEVDGGIEAARRFADALRLIPIATSLGGVETIIEIPFDLDFGEAAPGNVAGETGVDPALLRLSVGIEDVDDLLEDLERGLGTLAATGE